MCGIAGFSGPDKPGLLARMTDEIRRRGPDDEGAYVDGPSEHRRVSLGFRRLAIVDLRDGRQPMTSADGAQTIVFNGEIYNAPDLRRELTALGHVFRTHHSDTEVILQGYRRWGAGVVERLNGMFAFCIYDAPAGRLFFARDPFGKKPLYYAMIGGDIVFGSEIQCVLRHPSTPRDLDPTAVARYFAYGYVPAPDTLYRAVRKLPAGSTLTFDLASGDARTTRYWEYRMIPGDPPPGSIADWREELRELLTAAVSRRLMSDVPLGFFLSGGVDSTAVTALGAALNSRTPPKTFTIGFNEPSYDESAYAAAAALAIGSEHHCRTLDLTAAERLIPELLRLVDDPIADASLLPTWLLCGFAREQVTVALSGDGADELFAGYDTFDAMTPARLYGRFVPDWLHRATTAAVEALPRSDKNMSLDFKLRRALRGAAHPPARRLPVWLGPASPEEVAAVSGGAYTPDLLFSASDALWADCAGDNDIDRATEFFGRFYLGEGVLTKVDRASMLHSLEVRSPFLDRDLVAFVRRLPADVKYRRGARKWLLKQALKGLVPKEILDRKKKGFGIPLNRWMRHLPPPDAVGRMDLGIDEKWLRARWDDHRAGRADHRHLLWAWTALRHATDGMAERLAETSASDR
jgi:asparagine synthase (glutamine-hydrolysing)